MEEKEKRDIEIVIEKEIVVEKIRYSDIVVVLLLVYDKRERWHMTGKSHDMMS